jgi:signal transduction histidine kinase
MTRRITLAILATVWATLVAAGIVAYVTTRQIMMQHLHHAMLDQMMAPRLERYQGRSYRIVGGRHFDDLTSIREGSTQGEPHAQIISTKWIYLPGVGRHRSMTARVYGMPVDEKGADIKGAKYEPLILVYSREAYEFDPLMNRLGIALVIATLIGGAIAAIVARFVARTSLRPLKSTADVIGTIDDQSLDRRIDSSRLPLELVPVAEKLNGMLERIETAQHQRQRFLADAAHELRTPVAALLTAIEISLRRPRDTDSYRQTLELCLDDARMLRRLVEGLMTQVKAELAEAHGPPILVDASRIIDACAQMIRPLAEKRSIRLACDVPDQVQLRTQPDRLRAILINLLGNAVEYSPDGAEVRLTCAIRGERAIEIRIRDTGPGISPEHLPHIFEPFYRADPTEEASSHLGLGLFLVRTHARALGGDCSVESQLGEGTTFIVTLPVAPASETVHTTGGFEMVPAPSPASASLPRVSITS